ncbi:hypothetical protein [Sphingomonas sp. GC_Shp_3]|uniref:hypothetical protein n=1 Tax=Sphingomonas sp. GC_Shp_3 TaxID=2937383 RepID=UPI00226AB281|nr:hypothetical protein [Sphingomonas sp. GC_Shp_3]
MFRSFILGLGAITFTVLILYGLQLGVALSGLKFDLPATLAQGEIVNPRADNAELQDFEYKMGLDQIKLSKKIAQSDANHTIDTIIATYQKGTGWGGDLEYLGASRYSGWPGLCERKRFTMRPPREWTEYLVIGSLVSPHQSSEYELLKNKMQTSCASRKASAAWFSVNSGNPGEGSIAVDGAILFDAVIAAARSRMPLPFTLDCSEYRGAQSSACKDPREWLSQLDPAMIVHLTKQEPSIAMLLHDDTVIKTPEWI